jgi:hypothetical protein
MNKKLLGVLAVELIAIIGGSAAMTMTWTESQISMFAGNASTVSIGLFQDCACSMPFTRHDWDGVVQDQEYEVTAYVRNLGSQGVYITYDLDAQAPMEYVSTPEGDYIVLLFDDFQTRFRMNVTVIEGPSMPCQLFPIQLVRLPWKNELNCEHGFYLNPGKVIKIDIILQVDSVVAGGNWQWDFLVEGCAP